MRILLSATNFCTDPYAVYPLGMSVVAAVLKAAGHEVRQFDPLSCGAENYADRVAEEIADFCPELIGVSLRNLDNIDSRSVDDRLLGEALGVIRTLKRLSGVPMFIGGPGFSLYPERILELCGAEYGIRGEGEAAVLEVVEAAARGTGVGRVFAAPGPEQFGARYDRRIAEFYVRETHMLPVQTKRGCPFHCAYCTYPELEGRVMRMRDQEAVLRDLEYIRENFPEAMVYFVDSVFNDPGRLYEPLLREMIRRRLDIAWSGFITPAGVRDGDPELWAESGLIAADLGLDAATDETLSGLGKNFKFAEAERCARRMLELGIGVTSSVMFGGPGETVETIRAGIANLRSLEPAYTAVFSGIRLLAGAPLLEQARREGKVPAEWDGVGSLYYFAPGLNPEEVHNLLLAGFAGSRFCVYPPGSRNRDIQMIHRFGYRKLRNLQLGGKP